VARLNLGSAPEIIKVLSGRAETVAELTRLRSEVGDDPAVWLPLFMGQESGSAAVDKPSVERPLASGSIHQQSGAGRQEAIS
jgi:hypothetical protein